MANKSLGQVAYEAHTPDYRVQYDDLWLGHQRAWQAAAEAVAMALGTTDWAKRNAVIEAAKAALLGGTLGRVRERTKSVWDHDALSDLFRNTEALVSEEE